VRETEKDPESSKLIKELQENRDPDSMFIIDSKLLFRANRIVIPKSLL